MVDVAVALPEPRPGDDEDVVWGLSTAVALWARGERGDAIVWLRRAADAAAGAGQEARAGELQANAARLEQAMEPQRVMMPPPPTAARAAAETLPQDLLEPAEAASPEAELAALALEIQPAPAVAAPASRVAPAPPSTARTPTMTPPPATGRTPSVSPPPPRGPLPSYTAYVATQPRTTARTPILDPWADEPTLPSVRLDPALRAVQLEGDEVMVQLRRNQPRFVEDDDGVVTSAAPIDTTLRRAAPRPPTPPARKWTATGEQPPGYIAEAGAVPSKAPVPSRPRPPAPSPPASDAGDRPPSAAPPRPPSAAPAQVDPLNALTLPSTPSAISAVTLPATASTIPRERPMTVPPPAAPTLPVAPRLPAPVSPASPASSIRSPASVRPPPSSASVRPSAPRVPAPGSPVSSASVRPRPISVPAPVRRPELVLDEVEAFADLSAEMRQHLASLAHVEALSADEEVSAFGAALVLDGEASVCATIVDAHVAHAVPGALVPARGTLAEVVALRVVAGPGGARVAVWEASAVEEALRSCPWVLEDLVARADKLQAFAGATMGPMGELDDAARARLLPRFSVRVAPPRDVILDAGAPVPGVILVCVGSIELGLGGAVRAGEVLFPGAALDGAPAPSVARASASGAVLLVADRALSAELAASSPLAGLLAR